MGKMIMAITTTTLTKASAVAAVAAGLLFVAVQVNHPHSDVTSITTTEVIIRNAIKMTMAVLALVGITGIYLRQVRQSGVLGLLGYLLWCTGFILIMATSYVAAYVLPPLADQAPGYVGDVIAVAIGGPVTGDIGLLQTVNQLQSLGYLAGGLIFGIALFRAKVLPRWASLTLIAGSLLTLLVPVLPHSLDRLLAYPVGLALICLGVSLWREQRNNSTAVAPASRQAEPALR
jgi:hypothetical protein